MNKPLCIYHGNCADGFTAAWAVYKRLGTDVDFHEGFYGQEPPDVDGRDVILVDFSYKRDVLELLAARANSLLVLDHHKTAQADLDGLPTAPESYNQLCWFDDDRPIAALFDMERSGAGIAWDFFHPGEPRPSLINYIEDRDLWRFKLPCSREVNALTFSYNFSFENWEYLDALAATDFGLQQMADQGAAIERNHKKEVAAVIRATRRQMKIGGHVVPVVNAPFHLASDVGNDLAKGHSFAASYTDTSTNRVFSLRSDREGGIDVSVVAAAYGGGGHRNAAGFQRPIGWEGDV